MKGFDAFAGVIKSGGKTRRAAKMVILNIDHPDIVDFIELQGQGRSQGLDAGAGRLRRLDARLGSLLLHLLPERQQLRARHRRVHARRGTRRRILDPRRQGWPARSRNIAPQSCCARSRKPPGSAAIPACSSTPPSTAGTRRRTRAASTPPIPCSEYMFLDDSACNLASLNLMKFAPNGTFDVEAFKHAVDIIITAQEIVVDPSGYPDRSHQPQLARLPSARPRLCQSRRAAHGQRPALRLRRRTRLCRRPHRHHVRRSLPAVVPHGRTVRPHRAR